MRDCDFIPADYHENHQMQRAVKRRASLVGGLVAMMMIWFVAHQRQLSTASAMVADVTHQIEEIQLHATRKVGLEAEYNKLTQHRKLVTALESPAQLGVILSDLSRRLPPSMLLTKLTVNSPGVSKFVIMPDNGVLEKLPVPSQSNPRTHVAVNQDSSKGEFAHPQMSILGIARSPQEVIGFAASLEGSALFDRVQIQSQGPADWAGRKAEQFVIVCDLVEQQGESQ